MSLFTSNFRSEAKVLFAVAAAALMCEAGLRAGRSGLSLDVQHIERIPSILASLHARPAGRRVLFLGNSLTRRGVDLALIRQPRSERSEPAGVFADTISPDDSTISDWYYLFRKYVSGGNAPDYVAIGFVSGQLEDSAPMHPDRIAAYFGGWEAASEVFTQDVKDFGGRMDYALASTSELFSEKERLRIRLLAWLTPDYPAAAQRLNRATVKREKAGLAPSAATYRRLQRLLALCRTRRVQPVLVAMPLPKTYALDPAVSRMASQAGADFVDLRHVDGLVAEDFLDGFHLAPSGASKYSRLLLEAIQPILARKSTAGLR